MSNEVLVVGRKSWVARAAAAVYGIGAALAFGSCGASAESDFFYIVSLFLGPVVVGHAIYRFFYTRSVEWLVTEEGVRRKKGLIPGRTHDWYDSYDQIFEAFYHFGFIANLLGYGTVSYRTTEGTTSQYSEPYMHDARGVAAVINQQLAGRKAAPESVSDAGPAQSGVDQLENLAKLRASGALTDEEFEKMKARIIDG